MSNFVYNLITIAGKQAEIDAFVQRFCEASDKKIELSLEKAVPMPRSAGVAWARANWGTPEVEDTLVMHKKKGRLTLGFCSTDGPPFPVYEIYTKAFPDLTFDARYIDPANETGMAALGQKGEVTLTELLFSEELEAEFEPIIYAGTEDEAASEKTEPPIPTAAQGFFELPLSPFKHWRFRRIQHQLADYPAYAPPIPIQTHAAYLSTAEGKVNFDALMASKNERIGYLKALMAKQGLTLAPTQESLADVAAWFDRNGGYLVPYGGHYVLSSRNSGRNFSRVWNEHAVPWIGRWAGLNVILDLSLYFGDRLISANPGLQWKQYISKRRRKEPPSCENLACVGSAANDDPFSVIEYVERKALSLSYLLQGAPRTPRESTFGELNAMVSLYERPRPNRLL